MSEKRPFIVCSGCGAAIADEDQIYVQPFIAAIAGLRRGVDGKALDEPTILGDGRELTIFERPTTCAKAECVEKVLADPSWTRVDLNVERQRRREAMAAEAARHPPEMAEEVLRRYEEQQREIREQAAHFLAILESLGACARSRSVSLEDIQTAATMALEAAEPYLAYVRDIAHPPRRESESDA